MEKKPKHYVKNDKLVIRTTQDISSFAAKERAKTFELLSEFGIVEPKPVNPRIVNTSEGRIRKILFTIPEYVHPGTNNPYWNPFADLLIKLPGHTNFFILTHNSVRHGLEEWLADKGLTNRTTIGSLPDHLNFSVWAQDGYAITYDENNNKTYFAEPFSFPRYADGLMAEFASNITNIGNYQIPLYFQGGNLLIGDNFFLIGADYPKNSLDYINQAIFPKPDETSSELIKRLYCEYLDTAKELIYVGSKIHVPVEKSEVISIDGDEWTQDIFVGNREGTVQPLFHIDMFISLAGRSVNGKYVMLVGDPQMAADLLNFHEGLQYSMKEVFDDVARALSKIPSFEVIRNPLPMIYTDDISAKTRRWYFATANNCIVENYTTSKTVWLPTYGHGAWRSLGITDNKNKDIWESLGYTVNFLADFHPYAENLGAVHCINKYLERDQI